MRKLYDEFFDISEDKKVSDKVMMTRTIMMVITMVACLAAMSFSAYAYFSSSITSNMNTIKAAEFKTDVKVTIASTDQFDDALAMIDGEDGAKSVSLDADKTYQVTITKAGTAKTGFCVITAENAEVGEYHTQQLGVDVKQPNDTKTSITFNLSVTNGTTVTFSPHWGTSSYYPSSQNRANNVLYIQEGEEVTMNIKGSTNVLPSSQEEAQTESDTDSVQQNDTQSNDVNSAETEDAGQ